MVSISVSLLIVTLARFTGVVGPNSLTGHLLVCILETNSLLRLSDPMDFRTLEHERQHI